LLDRYDRLGPMLLAAIVGVLAGLTEIGFEELLRLSDWIFFDLIHEQLVGELAGWRILILPALVGPIVTRFARETRGQGVSDVMLAVETAGSRIRARVAPTMALTTALTLGSGGAAGRQGPSVQIGAGLGSTVAQALKLSNDNVRLLVACGVAGGVAAAFNAPIGGVFFALEIVLQSITTRNFGVVMIASLAATVTSASLLGADPLVAIPEYRLEHAIEIPLYAVLGGIAAVVGSSFVRLMYGAEDLLARLPPRSPMLIPAVGGLAVGLIALIDRNVMGAGQGVMDNIVNARTAVSTLWLLVLLKPLASAATLGSGGSGGIFRPSLFLGPLTDGIFGAAVHGLLPELTASSGAYATVGMAAVFAAVSHAPISAVLMLFEMTRDYDIMLPLMTAVAVATFASQVLSRGSVYTIGLERRGVLIEEDPGSASVMETLTVADAMSPVPDAVSPATEAAEVMRALRGDPDRSALVMDDDGQLVDLNEAISSGDSERSAAEIATRDLRTVFADQTLHAALSILGSRNIHALPVVGRANPDAISGILRRSDITQAYAASIESRSASMRRRRVTGDDVRYLELRVARHSAVEGHELTEVRLTEDAVVIAIRHDGITMIPRGHTRVAEGDRVTVLSTAAARLRARGLRTPRGWARAVD
jgi:CIC family chloride channel protein